MFPRLLTVFISLLTLSFQSPVSRRSISGPAISSDFADPALIQVAGTWYAFATTNGAVNVQVATSTDFETWTVVQGHDALKTPGAWSTGQNVWAPDVVQLADGSFVLYYSASVDNLHHCVGAATSKNVEGPYDAVVTALACPSPTGQGGAIDPAGFADFDGRQYVVYKVDGNSIGNGGNCGNGIGKIMATPIMLQEVEVTDGTTPIGEPTQILDRSDTDGPLVEAPSLIRVPLASAQGGWMYILFFSSNCFSGSLYDTSYATSVTGIKNPAYTKAGAPLLTTGLNGLFSPGSATVDTTGQNIVFHADLNEDFHTRQMWTGSLSIDAQSGSVTI